MIANNPPMTPAAAVAAFLFESITLGGEEVAAWCGLLCTLVGPVGPFIVVSPEIVPVGPGDEVVDDPITFTQYPVGSFR